MSCRLPPLIFALLQPLHAEQGPVNWFEHTAEQAWLHQYDPTLISRRLLTELSFEDDDGGVSTTELKTTLRGAFTLREGLALGLQFAVPLKWHDDGSERLSGLGDLEFRAGVIGRLSPTLRWGTGVNAKFDSAAEDGLGDGVFQVRPTFGMRLDATRRINLGFNLEYTVTPQNETSGDLSYLELKLPVAVKLSDRWSAALTYVPRWDFRKDDDRHRLTLEATRNWGRASEFAWSFGTELPLSHQALEWKLVTGFSWYLH